MSTGVPAAMCPALLAQPGTPAMLPMAHSCSKHSGDMQHQHACCIHTHKPHRVHYISMEWTACDEDSICRHTLHPRHSVVRVSASTPPTPLPTCKAAQQPGARAPQQHTGRGAPQGHSKSAPVIGVGVERPVSAHSKAGGRIPRDPVDADAQPQQLQQHRDGRQGQTGRSAQ